MDNFDNDSLFQNKHQKMFTITAVLIIYSVLSPMIAGIEPMYNEKARVILPNFLVFEDLNLYPITKLAFILPLLIGAAILVINFNPRISLKAKAITFMVFGLALFINILSVLGYINDFFIRFHSGAYYVGLTSIFHLTGLIFIFAAGRMILEGKINLPAYIIGSTGAAAYITSLFFPSHGYSPVEYPLELFALEASALNVTQIVGRILSLAEMSFLVTASVFCFLLWHKSFRNQATGRRIRLFWWLSQLTLALLFISLIIADLSGDKSGTYILNNLLLLSKSAAFLYGTVFFTSYGLMNLLTFIKIPVRSSVKPKVRPQPEVRSQPVVRPQLKQKDIEVQILTLKSLLDKELITVEEYNKKKREFLDNFN